MVWKLSGDYFENCNCDILCPCITSSSLGPADEDRCYVPIICHVQEGSFESISLNDLCFILVVDSPAIMAEGSWRVATYIDERADAGQREALVAILSGDHGGAPEMLSGLIGEQLGIKYVPIKYVSDGIRRRVEVPGIMKFEVEGITVPNEEALIEITNVQHPMGSNLPIAKSLYGHYDDPDYDFSFDNTGKNAHLREFDWQGE